MYLNDNLPKLDLHGENRETTRILVDEFINDNYNFGIKEVVIIHGIGTGILKKEVHSVLKCNRKVINYKLDNFNSGCTLISLSSKIDKNKKKCYNTQQTEGGY